MTKTAYMALSFGAGIAMIVAENQEHEDAFWSSDLQKEIGVAVQEGNLLRLDALQGSQMYDFFEATASYRAPASHELLQGPLDTDIQDDKWYGVLMGGVNLVVGPYDRKSQAMNALVLAISGVPVSPSAAIEAIVPQIDEHNKAVAADTPRDVKASVENIAAAMQAAGLAVNLTSTEVEGAISGATDAVTNYLKDDPARVKKLFNHIRSFGFSISETCELCAVIMLKYADVPVEDLLVLRDEENGVKVYRRKEGVAPPSFEDVLRTIFGARISPTPPTIN